MKLKSEVKIWLFIVQLVTIMRSGPEGQSQGIYLSNPHRDEGISMKHCHTGSKHYPTAALFSLAGHILKSKNSNTADVYILNVLGKTPEKSKGGLSLLLSGLLREEGDAQPLWRKRMSDHVAH